MKDYLAARMRDATSPLHGRNLAGEYLQARMLGSLQRAGAMIPLAFLGGTALRFLYGLPRFSEDLHFSLEGMRQRYDLRSYLRALQSEFGAEGYAIEIKVNDRRNVHSAFVNFVGLFYELKLSPRRDEKLSIKIEVDTNPPAGAALATTIVRQHVLLQLQHHDRASLLAGKLHAVLQRPYPKGRDLYDLLWHLSDRNWPEPNLKMLNNALAQTGWTEPNLAPLTWRWVVRERVAALPWDKVQADARPFLERENELALLTTDNLVALLT